MVPPFCSKNSGSSPSSVKARSPEPEAGAQEDKSDVNELQAKAQDSPVRRWAFATCGCSAAGLAHLLAKQKVAGSNPVIRSGP